MIPKIIHYIWLGDNCIPPSITTCIESWKKVLTDYKIIKWDNSVIEMLDFPFVKEAIREGKWAFASDVIRLWVLYKYGGIYLDTDVMVYKTFDDFLDNHAFIGRECCLQIMGNKTEYHLTSFCFGAEPENEYIRRCLLYYNNRHFILSTESFLPSYLRYDITNASYIHSEIARTLGYDPSALADSRQKCRDDILEIYPYQFFADNTITKETYCHHLSIGSWRESSKTTEKLSFKYKIKWRLVKLIKKVLSCFDMGLIEIK